MNASGAAQTGSPSAIRATRESSSTATAVSTSPARPHVVFAAGSQGTATNRAVVVVTGDARVVATGDAHVTARRFATVTLRDNATCTADESVRVNRS
mgnify:CR=1 FL=1